MQDCGSMARHIQFTCLRKKGMPLRGLPWTQTLEAIRKTSATKRAEGCAAFFARCSSKHGAIRMRRDQNAAWCAASLVRCSPHYAAMQAHTTQIVASDAAKYVIAMDRAQL